MTGYIYIASNPSMPGLIKIGESTRNPQKDRIPELSSATGVPSKFICEYQCLVKNYDGLERRVHSLLKKYRPNSDREFFTCSVPEAIAVIRDEGNILDEEVFFKSEAEIEAAGKRYQEDKEKQEALKKDQQAVSKVKSDAAVVINREEGKRKQLQSKDETNRNISIMALLAIVAGFLLGESIGLILMMGGLVIGMYSSLIGRTDNAESFTPEYSFEERDLINVSTCSDSDILLWLKDRHAYEMQHLTNKY